jgi:hypothetical protein
MEISQWNSFVKIIYTNKKYALQLAFPLCSENNFCSFFGNTSSPFCISFQVGSGAFCLGWPGQQSSYFSTSASSTARMTSIYLCVQLFPWNGDLTNFLPYLASNLDPPNLCFPSSWNYKCEPLHLAQKVFLIPKRSKWTFLSKI